MQKRFIIANWKANIVDHVAWLTALSEERVGLSEDKTIIVCPPLVQLAQMHWFISQQHMPLLLGSQDVSQFREGAYTGEVPTSLLTSLVSFALVGHSERRLLLHEQDQIIAKKCQQILSNNLMPILCVQGVETPIPDSITIVAYEPVQAIGSGNPDDPENVDAVAKTLKEKGITNVLYGGSVTPENVQTFTSLSHIDGVLVGKASLDPKVFSEIITNA